MPFQSKAQERFMYAKHPKIADKWQKEYGQPKNLPEHKKKKKKHSGGISKLGHKTIDALKEKM